jgi:signal transduction histidine kinase
LHLRIADDGRGGADAQGGTGLQGLSDRVRSVDGTFRITSPLGGPTVIEAELPCAS